MAQLLIVGLHPRLLEKSVVWFEKNKNKILGARQLNTFWRNHTLILEEGSSIKLSDTAHRLIDLGYVKIHGDTIAGCGTFLARGGELIVFPLNATVPVRIEFIGNIIERITNAPQTKLTAPISARNEFYPGDYVVHIDHGIGIFQNVVSRNGEPYYELQYAKGDMLYVPQSQSKRVSPYLGFRMPSVHRLGTSIWNITKRKAKEDVVAFAKQLLQQYATREVATRGNYFPEPEMEKDLASSFPFTETPDQHTALEEIFADMARDRPMDRLLCADVGFGKTEVALRAAFRAVCNKRQVALLAPTTILAEQHFQTFMLRLQALPIVIERLSRLEKNTTRCNVLKKLANGHIDIIIGTHRLLSRDVCFKNLGLLIIDEEQRFGVRQKEHIKGLQQSVDILSLSATPLPRTLHFALANIRPMSIIETPPPTRVPPRTYVLPWSNHSIKQAIEAELLRGGQVYVLSNHIRKLPLARERIAMLVPHAKIATLHGRMKEQDILQTMRDFREQKTNVLLATTIIENGLDVSNANTLIVEDATRIGLADAHQLRGRIGRGLVQSYAYFLYPTNKIKEKASRRLDALLRSQYLGAGREIALRDLEIRGAGNILGRDQSGRANQIGLNLYCQMLAEAVEELKTPHLPSHSSKKVFVPRD